MSPSHQPANFEINFGDPMRQFSDSVNDIQVWHDLIDLIDQVDIQTLQGPITLKLDWGSGKQFFFDVDKRIISADSLNNLVGNTEDDAEAKNILKRHLEKHMDEYNTSTQKELIVGCSILNPPFSDNERNKNFVIYFLHLIYLAMNLASPGSCNLWQATITWRGEKQELSKRTVLLDGAYLESACQLSLDLNWPLIEIIPVRKVWSWLSSLSISEAPFSRSNVERTIFAMLHVCTDREENINQADLLWLAHAFESLFDTPMLGISKALRDRIFLVLGNPSTNQKRIKKMLTSFYELRSAFVHGDSEIPNPMYHESTDEKYDDFFSEMTNNIEFALLIVIATLQKMITNSWKAIEFSEQHSGITFKQK